MVTLFHNLDELTLDSICNRVKHLFYYKRETVCKMDKSQVIREGDPVHQMMFIVQGHMQSSKHLSKGKLAT